VATSEAIGVGVVSEPLVNADMTGAPIALGVMHPRAVLDPPDTRITALTAAAYSVRPATGPQPAAQPSCHRRTQLWVV
jgi:hypothetical protein